MLDDELILLVDDDPDVLAMLSLQLQAKGWNIETAENGQQALEAVRRVPNRISMVISDVVMPVMDGYNFCLEMKGDQQTQDIPVLFVSSHTNLDEKIRGYGVGVDDYISKPVDVDELSMKLRALSEYGKKNNSITQQLEESQQVAFQAMTYSSDLGQILEFYKNSIEAKSFEELSSLLFTFAGERGVRLTLQIVTHSGSINFGDRGPVSPLEANLIEMSRSKGRFFDFGPRTLINYDDFSLLIKNMPLDDPERYGILKDTLGTLCNAIEARVKFLLYESSTKQKQEIVTTVVDVLEEIDKTFGNIQEANVQVINNLMEQLDEEMMELGLTSEQENLIRALVEKCRDDSQSVFALGAVLYDKFDTVRSKLDRILGE